MTAGKTSPSPAACSSPPESESKLEALVAIMARLRDPECGCAWDLEQNFKSIAPYTIEEAYEVADAIDRADMDALKDELGDLLFQVIFHSQMAKEHDAFDIYDVLQHVSDKMVYRHPHVFGDQNAYNAEDVNTIWDRQKDKEKGKQSRHASVLDGVTKALPALLKAEKLQARAEKIGFKWSNISMLLDKVGEELEELRESVRAGTIEEKAEELGDLIFVMVSLGRVMGVSAEDAVRKTNSKFYNLFRGMEIDAHKMNKDINDLSPEEMTRLWTAQKEKEKPGIKT